MNSTAISDSPNPAESSRAPERLGSAVDHSLVTFPANEMARVTGVKSTDAQFRNRLEEAIRDIKNDIAARRLRESLRKAAAEYHNHKEKK